MRLKDASRSACRRRGVTDRVHRSSRLGVATDQALADAAIAYAQAEKGLTIVDYLKSVK